jgi:ABC-type amino acid transport substrate-binding protein
MQYTKIINIILACQVNVFGQVPIQTPLTQPVPESSNNVLAQTPTQIPLIAPVPEPSNNALAQTPTQIPLIRPVPEPSNTVSIIPEIKKIIDRGKLIVITNKEQNPLFQMKDAQGEYIGLDVSMAKMFAKALDVKLEIVRKVSTNEEVVDSVARGEGDIGIAKLSYTTKRAKKVLFTDPYIIPKKAFIINRNNLEKLNKESSLKVELNKPEITIGVTYKSSYTEYAKDLFPKAKIQDKYKTWDDMLPDLLSGKIFGGFRDEIRVKVLLRQYPENSLYLYPLILKDEVDPLVMIVKKDAPLFLVWVNALLQSGEYKIPNITSLIEKYKEFLGKKL